MFKKLKQLFCRHEHASWCTKSPGPFFNLSGDTYYLVCDKCDKVLVEKFIRNLDGS